MPNGLYSLFQNPGLLNLVSELRSQYEVGRRLGFEGREPPMTLNNVTRPKQRQRDDPFSLDYLMGGKSPRVETELDPATVSFRRGYVDGLNEFMTAHGISVASTGLFGGLDVLALDDGLVGFVRGARLEASNIPRDYNSLRRRDEFKYIIEHESPLYTKARFGNLTTREGYILGFVVGVAREHGVVLEGLQVPVDNGSYQAFMQGLKGGSRALPFEGLVRTSKFFESDLNKYEDPITAEMRFYDWLDNRAYHTGLQIWLKSQGIQGVETWAIRHPEALRAFKAAITGRILPEYEPEPARIEFDRGFGNNEAFENYLKPEGYLFGDKFRTEPSSAKIAHQQGQVAYNLGKAKAVRPLRR